MRVLDEYGYKITRRPMRDSDTHGGKMSEHVYILKSQIAEGDVWGVYADRATAQQHADEAAAQMDDDNWQRLVIEEWEVGVAWGRVETTDL